MKIFILRHEERTIDATFFSPLTENGLIAGMKDLQMFYKSFITNILHCNEDMQLFNEEDKD